MANKTRQQHWDDMYGLPLDQIPWEITDPPQELIDVLDMGEASGDALDIACGTGNYSFYLAQRGFREVIGVDFSARALNIAKKRNETLRLPMRFVLSDVTRLKSALAGKAFDFILDYSLLHHLEPDVIKGYAQQCIDLLKPGGRLLLVCYSDQDEFSAGRRSATGLYGNTMFYHSAEDIRAAYQGVNELYYRRTTLGKRGQHQAHCFLFAKP